MTTPIRQRLAECAAKARTCEVSGCHLPRQHFGKWCEAHDRRAQETGHPLGRTIRRREFEPFVKGARRYLDRHQDHPRIAKALSWLEALVYASGAAPAEITRKSTAHDRLLTWLVKLRRQEVSPVEMLAIAIGICAYREWSPQVFRSDRHFNHQLAIRVLRLARAERITTMHRGCHEYRRHDRITSGVRDLLSEALNRHVGVVALSVARKLVAKVNASNPVPTALTMILAGTASLASGQGAGTNEGKPTNE
ncbi:hypothetical protein FRZ44_21380 [Hypericibacter terrae]|uniref:Uncharacterized protein n=1 Tax=Hypericibacter terrae TaxID=2602015 RepID=A0A5J6MH86_9PROT|nr:hypothetical protein [Hypericibacter terrae]QEX16843.1 hypothetical protein FRZ44_21380 [Hypericibacter terrae]